MSDETKELTLKMDFNVEKDTNKYGEIELTISFYADRDRHLSFPIFVRASGATEEIATEKLVKELNRFLTIALSRHIEGLNKFNLG